MWTVFVNGSWQEVANDEVLRQWAAAGHIRPDTMVKRASWPNSMPAGGAHALAGAWPTPPQQAAQPASPMVGAASAVAPVAKKNAALVYVAAGLGGLVLLAMVGAAVGGKAQDSSAQAAVAAPAAPGREAAPERKQALPPEPPPPVANLASEVPALEAKLAADKKYAALWTGPRADLNLFLTYTSELLAAGGASSSVTEPLKTKGLADAAIKLFMIHARVGRFPAGFTEKFEAHLTAVKTEPHLGTWTAYAKGGPIHGFAALAAWAHPNDAAYLREHIAARQGGPVAWSGVDQGREPAARPWLVDESAALQRLGLLTSLSADEQARLTFLKAEAAKPRQPRLGEEFKLGEYTYAVKSVEVVDAVGSGLARKAASEGARYVLVQFSIRNDGSSTSTVLTDDFRIVDGQSREYRPSSEANTALVMSGGKDLGLTELQPGLKKSMTTAFEVPEGVASGVFTLVIPEKGLLGTASVRITLK